MHRADGFAGSSRAGAIFHGVRCAWAIAKKDARVYYLKGPVITFGIVFPIFFFLAFAAGHDAPPATMVPGSSRWRCSSPPRPSVRWSRPWSGRRAPTSVW